MYNAKSEVEGGVVEVEEAAASDAEEKAADAKVPGKAEKKGVPLRRAARAYPPFRLKQHRP